MWEMELSKCWLEEEILKKETERGDTGDKKQSKETFVKKTGLQI